MNLNKWGSQRYNKRSLLFPSGQLRGVTLLQLVKSTEFRKNLSGLISFGYLVFIGPK